MIYKWVREELEKYSFVTKVELKLGYVYIHYTTPDETTEWRRISLRANRDKLIDFIESIKESIGYYENRQKRIEDGQYDVDESKPLIFANE